MKIERYEQVGEAFERYEQVFILPTIKYIFDKKLLGYCSLDFVWLRKGFSVSWGHKK
jgi:hypothetical protein